MLINIENMEKHALIGSSDPISCCNPILACIFESCLKFEWRRLKVWAEGLLMRI